MEAPQRILIVDGHALLKAGLRALLASEPNMEVCVETDIGPESVGADVSPAPHLLLIDRTMPDMNDADAVAGIRRRYPQARVLMITPDKSEEQSRASMEAGADGWVHKDATREELRFAIRSVMQGRAFLGNYPSASVDDAYAGIRMSFAGIGPEVLTPRERQVLGLVAAGKSSKDIAGILGLSVKTVGKHRANVMAKLDVHNAAGLTAYAIARGLVRK